MNIIDDVKLDFCDVLIKPKRSTLSSRKQVALIRNFNFLHGQTWSGIPIIASNMDTIGTFRMAKTLSSNNMLTCLHKFVDMKDTIDFYLEQKKHEENVAFTIGMRDGDFDKADEIFSLNPNIKFLCVDVANGYSQDFLKYIEKVRQKWNNKTIIAGNVVTPEMTEALLLAGADIIKVGIGNGSCCTTRKIAGVGYPQLSAIMECADAAHGLNGHILADGGCTCPGDVAKAFGANSDFVMLGGMLAGHDECDGEIYYDEWEGNHTMTFYGMSSETAMEKHYGEVASHRASEGKTVCVDYKGSVEKTIQEILGGLRSACTYVGARTIKQLPKCTTFVRVSRQLNEIFGDYDLTQKNKPV